MRRRLALAATIVGGLATATAAYESETHRELALRSAHPTVSSLGAVLRADLGLLEGLEQRFSGLSVLALIGAGAAAEDDPLLRPLTHFHDPLLRWDDAGLSVGGGLLARGPSSVLWQQTPGQDAGAVRVAGIAIPVGGGDWSWQDTRRRYRDALTGTDRDGRPNSTRAGREQTLAEVFLGLGHLMHLVQDATVPAHVRNDPHLPIPLQADGYERWLDRIRVTDRTAFDAVLHRPAVRPSTEIFTTTGSERAPVPVARLIDTDRFDGLGVDLLTDGDLGAAEYTSGNFLSRDTIFRDFALPRRASLGPAALVAPEGARVRAYFSKVAEGETVPHFVAVGALSRSLGEALQVDALAVPSAGFVLDDRVHADYAARLVPRAVGSSAALLDYFFRGRLDVDAFPDPLDPAVVELRGTNASAEALGGGRLTLYADDAAGRRRAAAPVDPADPRLAVTAAPGGLLASAPFRLPADSERLVAVYEGALGQELPRPEASPAFPGAVIGTVLGGVRAEELFAGAQHWQLRTPRGVFTLPLPVADYSQVRWGDGPDHLIAHTPLGGGAGGTIVLFEVRREPDGVEPLVAGSPPMVQLTEQTRAALPFADPPLVTTIQLSQTVRYRQQVGRYTQRNTFVWTPAPPFGPDDGFYVLASRALTPARFEILHEATVPFTATIPVRLDSAHVLGFGATEEPYAWQLVEVAADRQGRLLGLVAVFPTRPPLPAVPVPIFQLDQAGAKTPAGLSTAIAPFVHLDLAVIWVIVDLERGTLLATTAGPTVTIAHVLAREAPPWDHAGFSLQRDLFPGLYRERVDEFSGGPAAGTTVTEVEAAAFSARTSVDGVADRVEGLEGDLEVAAPGWLRPELADELARAGLLDFRTGQIGRTTAAWTYDCPTAPTQGCAEGDLAAFVATTGVVGLLAPPVRFFGALRARPAPSGERVVLMGDADRGGSADTGHVVVWDPGVPRAVVRFSVEPSVHALAQATSTSVLVWQRPVLGAIPPRGTFLVSLDGDTAPVFFPDVDLRGDFRLLDPRYLYRPSDLRFYRPEPPLRATALPARLVDVPGNPVGDYHLIRLP